MKQNKRWYLLLGGLAVLCLAALLLLPALRAQGSYVEIVQDGQLLETLPLDQDTQRRVEAPHGGYNVVEIKDGMVLMREATCRDQICVRHGPSKETADPLVCLPNRLVVQVKGLAGAGLDGVTA